MSGKSKWIVPNGDLRKHYDVFKVELDQMHNEIVTHVSEHAREEDATTQADALAALDNHLVNNLGMPEQWVGLEYIVRTRPSKAHKIYSTNHAKFGVDYSPHYGEDSVVD